MFDKVENLEFDCVIVGGGLAGCLLLHGLKYFQPDLRVLLLEKQSFLSSHQTWCYHTTDLPSDSQWLQALVSKRWSRQKVAFPEYERILNQEYNALRSADFATYMSQHYADAIRFDSEVLSLKNHKVVLADGKVISSEQIVDARGWPGIETKNQGYQKFVGWDVTLAQPHLIDFVFLKDVCVPQKDGYRFFYLLPWSENSLLIEDTYYSNSPDLDIAEIGKGIEEYIAAQGWTIQSIDRRESGCLPLPFFPTKEKDQEYISLGARSDLFHPVTGYTFPVTVSRVDLIVRIPTKQWKRALTEHDRKLRKQMRFLFALNRMLFLAAEPELRFKVLQRFYKLPADLIGRFYRGDLRFSDWVRILVGKPPVSIGKALRSLT
ncbi:lycopene beta-cyclase CrtY [Bdellovibrio sp. HCB290]|uniref:lycopene beta-cyclase CrtY n=1 Tax=Bdellovibrio sp. HCB290 TaxID=3394356 RepID=UPI0039B64FED